MGKFQLAVGLIFGIFLFIGEVHLLHCPTYTKHEAFRLQLLDETAICRSRSFGFNEEICLNGARPVRYYCSTKGCNMFGYNCDGHCLKGKEQSYEEHDFDRICDPLLEYEHLCDFYEYNIDMYDKSTFQNLCPHLQYSV